MERERAVALATRNIHLRRSPGKPLSLAERFERRVFSRATMRQMLPSDVYANVVESMDGRGAIKPEYADLIAAAMKEWAVGLGATHYSHWFQPLTGASAEKHDSFIDWNSEGDVIERFSGRKLIQGEPDASSFPSGGLRSTYEARGYTGWDPTSPPFVWVGGDGITLCIPSVFFSWTGAVLDHKIPLHRSDERMNRAVLRLLSYTGTPAARIHSHVGCEQEYFVVDRALRTARPDLVLIGRTVFGAPSPKGQELEDHYFGVVKDRILCFMQEVEDAALELGIPLKTRHNEVAPAQHEAAPIHERSALAVDHNLLLMELMRQIAAKHDLACLFHEKPFAGINGSGKHVNWSLATDTGINLFDPNAQNGLQFIFLLTAVLNGVHRHADLLRATVATRSNDFRLGSHEAPPAIISVYLGQQLEELLDAIEEGRAPALMDAAAYDLGVLQIPALARDNTDRNRTSPMAFTGNKFEYRAVGSSANCAPVVTALNLVIAESVEEMMSEVESQMNEKSQEAFLRAALPVIQRYLQRSKPVRYCGNNYSDEWVQEARSRGLPYALSSPEAYVAFSCAKAQQLYAGVLSSEELASRFEIANETYSKTVNIEAKLCIDLFRTQVLPAALNYQTVWVQVLQGLQEPLRVLSEERDRLSEWIHQAMKACTELEEHREKAWDLEEPRRAAVFCSEVSPRCIRLREWVDRLETRVEDRLWPLPKYRELLFLI